MLEVPTPLLSSHSYVLEKSSGGGMTQRGRVWEGTHSGHKSVSVVAEEEEMKVRLAGKIAGGRAPIPTKPGCPLSLSLPNRSIEKPSKGDPLNRLYESTGP